MDRIVQRIAGLDILFLPILQAEILAAAVLPHHHADPFDRILVAQAQTNSLTLVTGDAKIMLYDVPTLWQ